MSKPPEPEIHDKVVIERRDGTTWNSDICGMHFGYNGLPHSVVIKNNNTAGKSDRYYDDDVYYFHFHRDNLTPIGDHEWLIKSNMRPIEFGAGYYG